MQLSFKYIVYVISFLCSLRKNHRHATLIWIISRHERFSDSVSPVLLSSLHVNDYVQKQDKVPTLLLFKGGLFMIAAYNWCEVCTSITEMINNIY